MKYTHIAVPLFIIQLIMVLINLFDISASKLYPIFNIPSLVIFTIFGVIIGISLGMFYIDS